ncbi:MAG: GDP-fucose protein O-fucosyltransferase-domain-containing protein [Linnemannia elongata]|nr:MAG: GDP-fucose protein O-fucosyltransferase-domain-containing protein [Linnemannia elongata]
MPSSPKTTPKYMLGLPARPSSGRRCHSQKRILFLFSLVLLVSSGSMVILHITSTPFIRSSSLSCTASSSSPSSSDSAGCIASAASRRTRWRPDREEGDETSGSSDGSSPEERYRDNSPFRNHDRPRLALPRPAENIMTEGQEQPPLRPVPEPVPSPQIIQDQDQQQQQQLDSQHAAVVETGDQDQEETGTTIKSGNLLESPQLNNSDNENSDERGSHGSQDNPEDEDSRSNYDGEELTEDGQTVVEEPVVLPFEDTLDSEDSTKYLTYLPYAGITNQFYGMLRGMEVAKALGRTLIIPPITASSHDKSKQNQPWSTFFDLEKFSQLTGTKVIEFHQLRDVEAVEMNQLKCGITCGFGSKRTIDFTAKGFLKQWKFNITLDTLGADPTKLEAITSALRPLSNDKYVCISNTYKIVFKDKSQWERFGQHLHFTEGLESFVSEFLDRNLVTQEGSEKHSYLVVHARRGDFAAYCESNCKGPRMIHCLPSTEQIAARIDTVQTQLNPKMNPDLVLPVFVATNERRPEELKKFADLGWRYLDHDEMGTVDKLGVFGPMMVDQVFMAHAQGFVGIQMSTFSRVGALRQRDWHDRTAEYM